MAFKRVAWSASNVDVLDTQLIVPVHASVVNGDLMLLTINTPAVDTVTLTGWTHVRSDGTGGTRQHLYSRVANSEPANYTIQINASRCWACNVVAVADVDSQAPIFGTEVAVLSSTNAPASTALSGAPNGAFALVMGTASYAPPTTGTVSHTGSMTEELDVCTSSAAVANRHLFTYSEALVGSGSLPSKTFALTTAANVVLHTILVAPSASAVDAAVQWNGVATTSYTAEVVSAGANVDASVVWQGAATTAYAAEVVSGGVVVDSTANTANSSTSLTLDRPTGTTDGDYLIAVFCAAPATTYTTVPSGWAEIGSNNALRAYGKWANGEPANWTWIINSALAFSGVCVALRGLDPSAPVPIILGSAQSSTNQPQSASASPAFANGVLLVVHGTAAPAPNVITCVPDSLLTELEDVCTNNGSGTNRAISLHWEQLVSAGATGTRTSTLSASVNNALSLTFVAQQAVVVPPSGGRRRQILTSTAAPAWQRRRRSRFNRTPVLHERYFAGVTPPSSVVNAAVVWQGAATTAFNAEVFTPSTTNTRTAVFNASLIGRGVQSFAFNAVLGDSGASISINDASFFKVHAKTANGGRLLLERNLRYGNAGAAFVEAQPTDEAYIFPPENTREIWARARDISDRYGYELSFDEYGHLVLQPRNAPHQRVDFTPTDFSTVPVGLATLPNVAAYGGTYLTWTSGSFTASKTVAAARVDVVFPRGPGLGAFTYTVRRLSDNVVMSTGTIAPAAADALQYYDQRMTPDGINGCVATLYSGVFDTYTVVLTPSGATNQPRQLDCLLLYYIDPLRPLVHEVLDTGNTALDIVPKSAMDDMRNMVTVVGRRQAAVTDSEKFGTNPENPEGEFVVERQVVEGSIVDPTDDTFIGYPRESVIYDEKITDPDMAQYLANVFTFRYRKPWSEATVEHTLLPMLQRRDPLWLHEATHASITTGTTYYVNSIVHRLSDIGARTTIEATAYTDYTAYEPREDVDIDTYFGGQPVANVDLSYTSLTGHTVSNLPRRSVAEFQTGQARQGTVGVTAGSPPYLNLGAVPWPPIPGTFQLSPLGLAPPNALFPIYIPFSVEASSYVNTERTSYTDPNRGKLTPIVGGLQIPKNGVVDLLLSLTYDVAAVEIQTVSVTKDSEWVEVVQPDGSTRQEIQYWYRVSEGPKIAASATNDGLTPWYFEWYPDTQVLRVGRNGGDDRGGLDTYNLKINYTEVMGTVSHQWLADTPYHHLTNIVYSAAMPRVYLPWKEGDGSAPYQFPSAATQFTYRYRPYFPTGSTDPYAGVSPFFDPYTSEIGYLVTAKFDALVSGFYRVSVRAFDPEKAWQDSTVVAWLTNPTADADDPEAHFTFLQAGTKRFTWDGVDQRGEWNAYQSEYYATQAQGVFELDEKPVVGKGFYAWNREHVGGTPAATAFIADVRDAAGKPVFGQGTYGAWFLVVEVKNTALRKIAHDPANASDELKRQFPRVVATGGAQPVKLYGPNNGGVTEAYAFTHLSAPTRCSLEIKDWTAGVAFNDQNPTLVGTEGNWTAPANGAPADADATIHNEKPVRLRLTVEPRPGTLWTAKQGEAQVLVHRHAHLKAGIMDQFLQFAGINYPDTNTEQRTLVSRRMFNDRHTLVWKDTSYRRANTLKSTTYPSGTAEWIFLPRYFRKQFRLSGVTEALRFGDYLQLEEVPGWDASRQLTGKRARLQIAFMAYLFYLSAYTQDRSGRYCWAMNRSFLDQTKLIRNAYADWFDPTSGATPPAAANASTYRTDWPVDPNTQHRRTVVVRQWTAEPGWQAAQRAKWGLSAGSIGDKLLRHKWQDHEPTAPTLNGTAWPALNDDTHTRYHRDVANVDGLRVPAGYAANRQLGTTGSSQLGTWAWESAPYWIPCVSRDFHPYYKLPPMVGPAIVGPSSSSYDWQKNNIYAFVDRNKLQQYSNTGTGVANQTIGADPAALEIWATATFDHTEAYNGSSGAAGTRFWPNSQVKWKAQPTPNVQANVFDYIRQEENFTHYEELRGMFSFGKKPQQTPIKVSPGSPYYVNAMDYYQFDSTRNPWQTAYPAFYAFITRFFTMKFRSEYYWESGTLFPAKRFGDEFLPATNVDWTRYDTHDVNLRTQLHWDSGAWAGWKDDIQTSGTGDPNYKLWTLLPSVFSDGFQPIAVGPRLPVTKDMYYHLVLVPERRGDV